MSESEIASKLRELIEWQSILDEAETVVDGLKDALKEAMVNRDVEEMVVGEHIMRFSTVLSNRFDTTSFKKDFADMYRAYVKQVTSRRFTVS